MQVEKPEAGPPLPPVFHRVLKEFHLLNFTALGHPLGLAQDCYGLFEVFKSTY